MFETLLAVRLILFFLIASAAFGIGFLLPDRWMSPAFHYSAYYFILLAFIFWGVLAIDLFRKDFLYHLKKHASAFLLAVVLISLTFQMSPPKFKILADETNLIGVSMAMHKNKTVSMPLEGLAVEYFPSDYRKSTDPRPLLYPFVVSLFHAAIGYSPYNGMAVNFVCGAGILFLAYLLISMFFPRFFGFVAMITMASFPLFIFWITSSGFESINLFFIMAVMAAMALFLKSRDVKSGEFALMSLILLAHCRYESVLFIFPLIFLLPYFLNRKAINAYRSHVLCFPLFFIPLAWQRQIVFINPLVRGDSGIESPLVTFGISNFLDNFSQNIFALTGLNSDFGFIPLIFIAAVAGIYLFIKKMIVAPQSLSTTDRSWSVYFGLSGVLLFVLYTSFFWGQFTTDINNRLAMAMLPFILFPAVYLIYRLFHQRIEKVRFLLLFLLLIQMVYYWPAAAEQHLLKRNTLHYVNDRVTNYLYKSYDIKNEKLLLISDLPNLYIIHGIGSIGFQNAIKNQKKLHYFENIYYDHILVLQKCSPANSDVKPENQLDERFQLREIHRINISPDYYLRISNVNCRSAP